MKSFAEIDISKYDTLLLDRDGVINVLRPGDYVKDWSEFEFKPEFLDIIPQWSRHFKRIFIVTNQRGVAKGVMTDADLKCIHNRMIEEIRRVGGRIDSVYYCTALSDADPCRKPNRGMFDKLLLDYPDTDPSKCLMIGDSDSDVKFAENCKINSFKV